MRMLMNNLDPEVAENPEKLIVYGGTGRAARSWEAFDAIVRSLRELENDETLLVQSGKPVGVFRTHEYAPRTDREFQLSGSLVSWEKFNELERAGLMMYGQMTAGSWIYIIRRELCGNVRNLSAARKTFRRRPGGKTDRQRRNGRYGRSATVGRDHDRGRVSGD